jgi:transaldolase/glucose-6-phosphate isomerase
MSSVIKLKLLGQSVWYDNVSRTLINDGTFKRMIEQRKIYGVTSNPTIFQNAITNTMAYDADIQTLSWAGLTSKEIFYKLAIKDIQDVADLFRPYYDASKGADGYVSLEVDPRLAYDTQKTIDEVKWVWEKVNRPNLMVKIPATEAGLPAITEAIAAGINVNVTLIFSNKRYEKVMDAYVTGLEKRLKGGNDVSGIASVASFFVSRLETIADDHLSKMIEQGGETADLARSLKGKIAVHNTRKAYEVYQKIFNTERFKTLEKFGAKKQRPLWASTSTKDPAYPDIKYVEELVAENTVNTIPPKTLDAYLDHGRPAITIFDDLEQAESDLQTLESIGISLDELTDRLEEDGVRKFEESFDALLSAIEEQRKKFLKELGPLKEMVQKRYKSFKDDQTIARMNRIDPTIWTDDPKGKDEIQKRLGWLKLPNESMTFVKVLNTFTENCMNDGIDRVLLLGMGGSSLAPETTEMVMKDQIKGMSLMILDSTVPAQVKAAEEWVDYDKTLFIVASKSGSTTETMSMFYYFWERSKDILGETRGEHFVAITDPGSSLMRLGRELGFREVFTANPNVGGRYSALSHFGLVPAALMGVDLGRYLDIAQKMAEKCAKSDDLELNIGALLGIILGTAAQAKKDKLTILADDVLSPMGAWLEQLVAESSGKEDRGIVPIADEPLVKAEMYQKDRLFVYLRHSGDLDAFVLELKALGHPVVTLNIEDLYALGAHFYLWEIAVAVACSVLDVNAFDQPNVQDSKDRTKKKINAYLESGKLDEISANWEKDGRKVFGMVFDGLGTSDSLAEVVRKFSSLSKEGDYIAINAYVPRNDETISQLSKLRHQLVTETGCATTLGFGPRFQHSTGQLHKGGANNGLFIQVTQDDQMDLDIPGKDYSFGVLARAQAQGDLEALLAKDRRAIRVHLREDDSFELLAD